MQITVSGNVATIIAPVVRLAASGINPLSEGLTEGGDKVRTKVRRALKAQTNVKAYATITSHVPSVRSGLTYIIKGEGSGLPIELFPVSASGSVKASPWGVARIFKRSFANTAGFRARLSSKRLPIRKLFGPAISKEIIKDESHAAFEAGVRSDVLPAIEKRLARLLG